MSTKQLDLSQLELFDHHCHGVVEQELSRQDFEELISESTYDPAKGTTRFDTHIGFAIRNYCAPILGLPRFATAEEYVEKRRELGAREVNKRLLRDSRMTTLGIETGHAPDRILGAKEMGCAAEAQVYEIVRLERVAEEVAMAHRRQALPVEILWDAITTMLEHKLRTAIGVKSIAAYRIGLDFNPEAPTDTELDHALCRWYESVSDDKHPRLVDSTIIRALIWFAIKKSLPIQFHIGYGDNDVDLHRCNPLLLTDLLRKSVQYGATIMLLHCYPFHREAGYLADVFPHVYCDVGLAINYTGARSTAIIAESIELAPFTKVLFSSDAFGLSELYYTGARLFRCGLEKVLQTYIEKHGWPIAEAQRVAEMIGYRNAMRAYHLENKEK
ncbi:amidohydrolase [Corynebacterium sp. sy017]|uniref:amidohydrolase family protein n=1 Tax=unclassified Corynebacterium TaxID=2624378 RepID=UPI001185A496|nr:amidohydrolase family protein [Corynebacterium sp. SY003]MBP3087907.1 amidohydrolase [Corynebacterium sp. sy017]TSD92448.1 amidohydrolase [Corynebacterium sp. SY003]